MLPPNPSDRGDPRTFSSGRWLWRRVRRHLYWARTQGLARMIEEDRLNPIERVSTTVRKAAWRLRHDASPTAVPVFVVGLQRSGTNMLVRGFERSARFEVHSENDPTAFYRFRLRPDPVIKGLVERSRHPFVLFKPLCDSHRVGELLDDLGTPSPGRALWVVRSVDGRVRSSLEKFGPTSLRILDQIAGGRASSLWQSQGLSEGSLELLRSFDYARMSAPSASALFWYVRNAIVFEQGLVDRSDLAVVSYDRVIADPAPAIRQLCSFLGVPYEERYASHITSRTRAETPLDIDSEIRRRCDELWAKLDAAVDRVLGPRPV